MAKEKLNKFNESLEVSEEQAKHGVSIIDGRRCLHGLNTDQHSEMDDLGLGLPQYKKLKNISEGKAKAKPKEVVEKELKELPEVEEPTEDPKKKVKKSKK